MSVKESFHQIIDKMDETELKGLYQLFQRLSNRVPGGLWNNLTKAQKEELLLAYNESHNSENLVSHEEAKRLHQRWLKQ